MSAYNETNKNPIKHTHNITDTHGHYIFGVDDGATSMDMSLEMIQSAYEQGVRNIFCTSHDSANPLLYQSVLATLREALLEKGLDVALHAGCEIYCDEHYMDEIIQALHNGDLLPMGTSNYVLMEFAPWATKEEIFHCVSRVQNETDFRPIVAHFERCLWVHDEEDVIDRIKDLNVAVQVNAYSLVESTSESVKAFARKLLEAEAVTFVGSDAHRSDHRPVNLASGINYIYETCDEDYANAVCYGNAQRMLLQTGE